MKLTTFISFVLLSVLLIVPQATIAGTSSNTITAWQAQIRGIDVPGRGCFTASFPATVWTPVSCKKADNTLFMVGGVYSDYTGAANAYIYSSVGQVTSETQFVGECMLTVVGGNQNNCVYSNDFSIQLNTNLFQANCNGHTVTGVEQFLYKTNTNVDGHLEIQYWLRNCAQYGCPSPFSSPASDPADCEYTTSPTDVQLPGIAGDSTNYWILANLTSSTVTLYGKATSSLDTAEFCFSSTCWANTGSDYLGLSNYKWLSSEWNLFGPGGGSEAYFYSPFSITIRVDSYVKVSVSCTSGSITNESNNMNLGGCSSSGGEFTFSEST